MRTFCYELKIWNKEGKRQIHYPLITNVYHNTKGEIAIVEGEILEDYRDPYHKEFTKFTSIGSGIANVNNDSHNTLELKMHVCGEIVRDIKIKEAKLLGYSENYNDKGKTNHFHAVFHGKNTREKYYYISKCEGGRNRHIILNMSNIKDISKSERISFEIMEKGKTGIS